MCVHSLNYRTGQNGLAVGNENQVPKGRTKKSSPEGTNQLSPARQRWVGKPSIASPGGTTHVDGVEDQPMRYFFCLRQTPIRSLNHALQNSPTILEPLARDSLGKKATAFSVSASQRVAVSVRAIM